MFSSFRRSKSRERKPPDTVLSDPGRQDRRGRSQDVRSNVTAPPRRNKSFGPHTGKWELERLRDKLSQGIKERIESLQPDNVLLNNVSITQAKRAYDEMMKALDGVHAELEEMFAPSQLFPVYPGWEEFRALERQMTEAVSDAERLRGYQSESQSEVLSPNERRHEFEPGTEPSAPPRSAFDHFFNDDEMPVLFTDGRELFQGRKKNSDVQGGRLRFSDRRQEFGPITSTPAATGFKDTGATRKGGRGTQEYARDFHTGADDDEVSPGDSVSHTGDDESEVNLRNARQRKSYFGGPPSGRPFGGRNTTKGYDDESPRRRHPSGGLSRRGLSRGGLPGGGLPGGGLPGGGLPGGGPPGGGWPGGGPPGGGPPRGIPPPFPNNSDQWGPQGTDMFSTMVLGLTDALRQGLHSGYNIKQHVMTFSGEGSEVYSDYVIWREAFLKQKEYLQTVNKSFADILQEMKNTLSGSALDVVKTFKLTDGNLEVALQMLDERFCDANLLVRSQINKMIDIKPLTDKSSTQEMWNFYADINSVRQRFAQLNLSDADVSCVFFQYSIERKLSPSMRKSWNKRRTIFQQHQPGRFSEFQSIPLSYCYQTILQEIKAAQALPGKEERQDKPQGRSKQNFKQVKGLTYTVAQEAMNVQCHTCDNPNKHNLATCKELRAMPVKERWVKLKGKKICGGCQNPLDKLSHARAACTIKCDKCGRGHHVMFHDDEFYKQKALNGKTKTKKANVHATSGACEPDSPPDQTQDE